MQLLKLNIVLVYFTTDLFLLMQNDTVKDNEIKIDAIKIQKIAQLSLDEENYLFHGLHQQSMYNSENLDKILGNQVIRLFH